MLTKVLKPGMLKEQDYTFIKVAA